MLRFARFALAFAARPVSLQALPKDLDRFVEDVRLALRLVQGRFPVSAR